MPSHLPSTHDAGSREFDPRSGYMSPAGAGFSWRSLDGLDVLVDAESESESRSTVCLSGVADDNF
jgi:hypothetical protein